MKRFVLLACLVLALTVTACTRNAAKTTMETPADPLDKLAASIIKMGKAETFRAKTTRYDAVQTSATEFQAPDRFHWTSSASSDMEFYQIEGTDYYKVAPNQWKKREAPAQITAHPFWSAVDPRKLKTSFDAATTKKFMGTEVLDGEPTLVFEYTVDKRGQSVKTPSGAIFTFKIWIGVSDSLPRKLDISTRSSNDSPQPGYGSNTNYYDYNENIKIKSPIKL